MTRPYRHVHPGGSYFEVTTRVLQGRFLLPVGPHFRRIAIGIMARAKRIYPVELYAFGGLSGHLHMLLGAKDVDKLAGFVGYVKSNLAKEAGRIVDWEEKFWGRRYRAIEISDEEEAWIDRVRYVMSHGPKENLVLRCRDWPGIQCIDALTRGEPLEGVWYDRTHECHASRRGKEVDPEKFRQHYTLELDPLPCWRHLSKEEIQQRFAEIVAEIDAQNARRVVLGGRPPLGVEAICRQDPYERPMRMKKTAAPDVHAISRSVRKQMKAAYRLFVEAYREAAVRLRDGDLTVEFPPGCFPPPRRFVSASVGNTFCRAGPALVPG